MYEVTRPGVQWSDASTIRRGPRQLVSLKTGVNVWSMLSLSHTKRCSSQVLGSL